MSVASAKHKPPNAARRDPKVRRAILDATVDLLEQVGYRGLSIEAIAARAGVGKQTIYRWWPGKAALMLEAYLDASEVRAPEPDTGTVEGDLEAILLPVFALTAGDSGAARAVRSLIAEAQLDPDFHPVFVALVESWHGPLRRVLERGQGRGELHPDADLSALMDLLQGAGWYRLLLRHAPLDETYARTIIRTVIEGNRQIG